MPGLLLAYGLSVQGDAHEMRFAFHDQLRNLKNTGKLNARDFEWGEKVHPHGRVRGRHKLKAIVRISRDDGHASNLEGAASLQRSEGLSRGNDSKRSDLPGPVEVNGAELESVGGHGGSQSRRGNVEGGDQGRGSRPNFAQSQFRRQLHGYDLQKQAENHVVHPRRQDGCRDLST